MEKSPHTVNFPPRLHCTGASRESLSAWWSSGLSAAFQLLWANFLASFIARKGHPREDKGRFPRALPPAPLAGPTHLSGCDKLGSAEDNAHPGSLGRGPHCPAWETRLHPWDHLTKLKVPVPSQEKPDPG